MSSNRREQLRSRLPRVPRKPGVYLMRDKLGKVIYVGKAINLRSRLAYYFRPTKQTLAQLKTRALIDSIEEFEFHVVRNEAEALLLEGKWIKEYQPRYNVSFRDDKRFLLLKLRQDVKFPRFELVRQKKPDQARYFGPFAYSSSLRETIHWLNRRYGLRSCRPKNPTEVDYKHCSADVIRNCSAPCVKRISVVQYEEKLNLAVALIEGKNTEAIAELKQEMQLASEQLEFEKAASLRDIIANVEKTIAPARKFQRSNDEPSLLKEQQAIEQLQYFLRLSSPPLVMECFDISNVSNTYAVASMVRFVAGKPDKKNYRRYRIRSVEGQNDFAAMAEAVARRYKRLCESKKQKSKATDTNLEADTLSSVLEVSGSSSSRSSTSAFPDVIVVDGGKGQLTAAREQLVALGLKSQVIIGLAKQQEAIFFPDVEEPLLLPHSYSALQLLQRLRDEAHRFANGYHQLLANKRIRESLLDAVEGIGPKRKHQLLQAFGSVERIQQAGVTAIAKLPGFSQALAQQVCEGLHTRKSAQENTSSSSSSAPTN